MSTAVINYCNKAVSLKTPVSAPESPRQSVWQAALLSHEMLLKQTL